MENSKGFFSRQNYILLGIGIIILLVGYLLMMGGGSEDPTEFNDAIFNAQRITIAPIVVLFGYLFVIYAIMKKPKKD